MPSKRTSSRSRCSSRSMSCRSFSCSRSKTPPSPPPLRRHGRDSHSRSFSSRRSYSPKNRRRRFSRSRSPLDLKRGPRERPAQCRCIGIFGMSVYTTQQKIREIFVKFGPIERIQMVIDAKTGRSRGFCFVYYDNIADAKAAKESCSGMEIDDRRIRVDYSITQRPHTPTPGIYMGRPTNRSYSKKDYDHHYDDYRPRRRSPSYRDHHRHFERSRSRSYSLRRRSRH